MFTRILTFQKDEVRTTLKARILSLKMNMRTPKSLRDKDPLLSGVPVHEGTVSVEVTDDLTDEEIEDFEREVEQQLLEEEFIAACFEEMWAEEEAQWQYYYMSQQVVGPSYVPMFYTEPTTVVQTENRNVLVACSKLNPEAPEFIPRGMAL